MKRAIIALGGRRLVLILLNGMIGLLLLGLWQFKRGSHQSIRQQLAVVPAIAELDLPAPAGAPGNVLPSVDVFAEITRRPLMQEGRKPLVADEKAKQTVAPDTPFALQLHGVLLQPGGAVVLLRDPQNHYRRLKQGEMADGWRILEVRPDGIVLEQNGNLKTLLLDKPKPKPGQTAASQIPCTASSPQPCVPPPIPPSGAPAAPLSGASTPPGAIPAPTSGGAPTPPPDGNSGNFNPFLEFLKKKQ